MAAFEAMESRCMLSVTILVDQFAAGNVQDGLTWDTAYLTLRDAINAAQSEDTILIAGGTYRPNDGLVDPPTMGGPDRTVTFSLKSGVDIYGGFAGSADPGNPYDRDIEAYETILSGDIGINGDNIDNSYHVVTASGVDATAVLDGVTISDGNASAPAYTVPTAFSNTGGGLIAWYGSPTIRNCVFDNNSAYDGGGGLFADHGSVTVTDCTFSYNSAVDGIGSGGGIALQDSTGTIEGCFFYGNAANMGGGLTTFSSSATLSNCIFIANDAASGGGAIANDTESSLTLTNVLFAINTAGNYGGAILDTSTLPTALTNCTFLGNSANFGGAIIVFTGSSASTITNCVFSANIASVIGGAIYNLDSSPTLTNCTFASNRGLNTGGGIFNNGSSPSLANCILWGNYGGEIVNSDGRSRPIVSFSDVQDGWAGMRNVNVYPIFLRDPNPGDDGVWGTDLFGDNDDDFGDLRLDPISPLVDAGSNALVPADTTTDIDGNERFVDVPVVADTGSGVAPIVDMGAYETPSLWPVSFDTDQQDVNETDGTVTVSIELITALPYDVTVQLNFGGSAAAGVDYTIPGTLVTIPAGDTTASMTIQLLDDGLYEPEKTILVSMGTLGGAVAGDIVQQTITIFDDTDSPSLDPIADQTVNYTEALIVVAHADDPFVPGPSLEYSLDGVVPAGASISPDGVFTWIPLPDEPAGVYTFTIRVSSIDNPGLSDVSSFQVQHTVWNSTLSGNLFRDRDRNNQVGADEGGIAGWTVYADLNNNGNADVGEPTTLTDANGHWEILGMAPGNIHVVTVVPAGWLTTTPVMTNLPFDVPSNRMTSLSPVGYYRILNYTGSVFQDANLNEQLDGGEVGLAGSTVWADLNDNGAADAGEPLATVDANGAFALNAIWEGDVVIRTSVPSGWIVTNYPDGYTTPTIADDQQPTPILFSAIPLGPVLGNVYDDANGNGVRDASERGFAAAAVWLDLDDDSVRDASDRRQPPTEQDNSRSPTFLPERISCARPHRRAMCSRHRQPECWM